MIKFETAFIIEEVPKNSKHRMIGLISSLPFLMCAEIELVNTSLSRNNKVNRVKVYPAYDSTKFVIVSQNELDNILSQCKLREDYKQTFLV